MEKSAGTSVTPPKPRKRFRWVGILLMLGLSAAVALLVGEIACRYLKLGDIILYERGLYVESEDPDLAYELKPGYDGTSYGSEVAVNSMGFRGPECTAEPPPGVFRVVCVGDSFTFGMGVTYEQAWPAVLQKELPPPAGFNEVEVINAGVSGYNLVQYCQEIADKVIPLKPNLVVVGLVGNDLAPSFHAVRGYLVVPRKKTTLPIPGKRWLQTHSHLYQFINMKYQAAWTATLEKKNPQLAHELTWQDKDHKAWEEAQVRLTRMRRELRDRGIRIVAARLLLPEESPIPEIMQHADVPIVPVEIPKQDRLADGHPNPAGHESIARQLASALPHFL